MIGQEVAAMVQNNGLQDKRMFGELQHVSSPLQLGKGITQATVYTNPLFH
jgi:ribosome-binding factor A